MRSSGPIIVVPDETGDLFLTEFGAESGGGTLQLRGRRDLRVSRRMRYSSAGDDLASRGSSRKRKALAAA